MNTKKQNKKKKGFTLIELIIVIAIIAILAAIAIPNFLSIQRKSKVKADVASAKTIYDATSALIAEGKIVPSGSNVTFTLNPAQNGGEGTITASNNKSTEADSLKSYLQTIPAVKTNSASHFEVVVGGEPETPSIQVKLSDRTLVYPNGEAAFNINGDGTGSGSTPGSGSTQASGSTPAGN
ncbi:prepilin-type N-terminal cleavage/methylation domain-containing protein [Clostridium perfringens]|uniref:prepilin-type N-terminal cleavage/methylation domain-containing protein n=1 Tax=Clostridium perfringens TaxID=1502 RepID=UPI001CCF44D0|nr:prepilin-type N-terminal cleavage/methylation domain-containing protein [Clostridium perfringens]UBK77315.1 prepilin-type N-terminal cleavage/methylation domain-containing protein [Clostridium perfringens]